MGNVLDRIAGTTPLTIGYMSIGGGWRKADAWVLGGPAKGCQLPKQTRLVHCRLEPALFGGGQDSLRRMQKDLELAPGESKPPVR